MGIAFAPMKLVANQAEDADEKLVALGRRLEAFRLRYQLSIRALVRITGGATQATSKSSLSRILRGEAPRLYMMRIIPVIQANLKTFLIERGHSEQKAASELRAIFKDFKETINPLGINEMVSYDGLTTWCEKMGAFRRRHNLSIRKFWGVSGGEPVMASNVMWRISHARDNPPFDNRIKPLIRPHLHTYLLEKGISPDEATAELNFIFEGEEETMIVPRATLTADVQRYFGLRRDPFTGDPRSRAEVFSTAQVDKIAAQIEDAINYQGFLVVTGEIGSGKSILKRRAIDTVEGSAGKVRLFWPEFFNMDRVHSGSIVSYLLHCFDQTVPSDLVARAAKLKRVLADSSAEGVRVALGFDECHQLHDRLLTALKNFWELGSGGYDRYLGVVLFGQPQFEGRLRDHRFREICERIEVVRMPSLEKSAWEYVAHRVKHAGGDAEKLFERDAVKRLSKLASTPLALGNLANAALLKAHSFDERKVRADFVKSDDGEPQVRALRRTAAN